MESLPEVRGHLFPEDPARQLEPALTQSLITSAMGGTGVVCALPVHTPARMVPLVSKVTFYVVLGMGLLFEKYVLGQ